MVLAAIRHVAEQCKLHVVALPYFRRLGFSYKSMALRVSLSRIVLHHQRYTFPLTRVPPFRLVQFKGAMAQAAAQGESSKDIIERIKHDHRELDDYYNKYKSAVKGGDKDGALKWFNQFVWEICRHSVSEEIVIYPLLEGMGDRGRQLADKSRKDHHKVKELLSEMESISEPMQIESKMDAMMKELREHINMEEHEDLVLLRENLDLSARETAGASFDMGKQIAPTRPHTMVPEKPVMVEAALGLLATPVDKLRDMFTSFPKKNA